MSRRQKLYEGKTKIIYLGVDRGTVNQYFKDDATAFNKKRHEVIEGKGVINNLISEYLFRALSQVGIPNHFKQRVNMREQLTSRLDMIPIEIVIRNSVAGSLAKRFAMEEGTPLSRPIMEMYYKSDETDDPMISEDHVAAFDWATAQDIDDMAALAFRSNDFLSGLFHGVGLKLVDIKFEFGKEFGEENARVMLGDEITPDTCRLWDITTGEKLDKDRFRFDLGDLMEGYRSIARKLGIITDTAPSPPPQQLRSVPTAVKF